MFQVVVIPIFETCYKHISPLTSYSLQIMLQPKTIQFLKSLADNNNKPWFDEHRKEYETAKQDFERFADELMKLMQPLVPELEGQRAKDLVFRIFRDVRFSKDKTPYKANFGVAFSRGGKKDVGAGYYLHVQPGGKSFAAGGIWMPDGPMLKKIRQEIDYNLEGFEGILKEKAFKKLFSNIDGERLSRPPQGYDADNPAIEYLKLKSFTVATPITDKDLADKNLGKKVTDVFTTMSPFIGFLNEAVG